MRTYEKIETVFNRDIEGSKQLIPGSFRNETVEFLQHNEWEFTEKVDGTNVRVHWDGHKVEFAGRTERAELPKNLLDALNEIFGTPEAEELCEQTFGEKEVILFGEGYGGKIQGCGRGYRKEEWFVLFDILIGDNYQSREWVEKTAQMFGVQAVPILFSGSILDGVLFVCGHQKSVIAENDIYMEGIVGRPKVELKDRCGNRVIVKIKWNDFKDLADVYLDAVESDD